MKKIIFVLLIVMILVVGCEERQSDIVSHNLSLETDNFNVARKLTVIDTRTDTIHFQMTGNFSIQKEADGDLTVIGENEDGKYYKHFIYLSRDITYIVEDLGKISVGKYNYTINFNPKMILPVDVKTVD